MRAVADALGVTAMALYHYVEDKTALVGLVVDEAISDRPLPAPTGAGWQEDVIELARWMREGTQRHPGIPEERNIYVGAVRVLQGVESLGERWLGLWLQSGLPLDAAAEGAMTTLMAINGMVDQEAALPSFDTPDDDALAWFPNLRVALTDDRDRDAAFDLVVRSVVTGVHGALAARTSDAGGESVGPERETA